MAAGGKWFPALESEQLGKVSRLDSGLRVSAREYEVLCYNYHGLEYKEIAAELDISYATVDTHFRHLRKKFKVHNGRELVAQAIEHGILELGAPPPPPPDQARGAGVTSSPESVRARG